METEKTHWRDKPSWTQPEGRNTGFSSKRYGPCEVCGEHVSETFIKATSPSTYAFGHAECMKTLKRTDPFGGES